MAETLLSPLIAAFGSYQPHPAGEFRSQAAHLSRPKQAADVTSDHMAIVQTGSFHQLSCDCCIIIILFILRI
jgi:hypothetical protein